MIFIRKIISFLGLKNSVLFFSTSFKIKGSKIFVISFQRTGTTSTGQFFEQHGFNLAPWGVSRRNNWTINWFKGDYDKIFKSLDFKINTVFEDDPWWCQDFYKVLFHRFPRAKFVLLERDPDKWFDSMISHSNGKSLGNTHRHASIYRREKEIFEKQTILNNAYSRELDNQLTLEEKHRNHYKEIYMARNNEIKIFFEKFGPDRIFLGNLEDKFVWQKMGEYFGICVTEGYSVHANKSK